MSVQTGRGSPTSDREAAGLELIAKAEAVLHILEVRGATSAPDIAAGIGEPLSSVYRLLQSLTTIGWVDKGPRRGTYRLGLTLLTIGSELEDHLDIRESARPSLRRLRETVGVTSFLCVRRDARAACIERLEGHAVRSLAMQLGSSLPLYAGAAPQAILAFLPPAEQDVVLHAPGLPGDPPRRPLAKIKSDIARIRRDGFAVSDEDVTPGIAALGAPVFNHRGELEAAISISGLRDQILGPERRRNIEVLLSAADDVSRALGRELPQ